MSGGFFTHMNTLQQKEVANKPSLESEQNFFNIEQRPKHPFRPQAPSFRNKSPNTEHSVAERVEEQHVSKLLPSAAKEMQMKAGSEKSVDLLTPILPTIPPHAGATQLFESSASLLETSDRMGATSNTTPSRPVSASARSTSSTTAALMERDRSRRLSAPPKRSLETLSSLPTKQQWTEKEEIIRRLSERLDRTKRLHRDKMELCTTARAELGKQVASALVENNTTLRCQVRTLHSRAMEALQEADHCLL